MTYIQVAGHRVWHEVSGDGEPVVLLHGDLAIASSFAGQVPALVAAGRRVYVPERRAHGHTPDIPGPLTYELMAEDTIAYLDQEFGRSVPLIGWSGGAVVALLVAMRRPDLVERMALIGQYYNASGQTLPPGRLEEMFRSPELMQFLRQSYDPFSPDGPGHFEVVYDKALHMFATEPELDLSDFGAINVPTLVIQGDRDFVTLEHSQQVVAALPDARLAVLPGTHGLPLESPETLNPLLISFLRGEVGARNLF